MICTGSPEIVLDAHSDMLLDVLMLRRKGRRAVLEERFLPPLRAAGFNAVVCSLFILEEYVPELALRNALDQISAMKADLEESPSFSLCRNAAECRAAVSDGKIALFLSLEGAEPLGRDILLLRSFYDLGVRLLGFAWSRRNYACDGISFEEAAPGSSEGSLTSFGRALAVEAGKLGMVLDVSHLNDPGFFELSGISKSPFIASHSNCRALTPSPRNLTDEQMTTLASAGGVAGMNAYAPFSQDAEGKSSPETLFAHLDHLVEKFGAAHAGLGLDLCSCLESLHGSGEPAANGDIFDDHADAGRRFIAPLRSRYGEDAARWILGENFMRVFEKVMR